MPTLVHSSPCVESFADALLAQMGADLAEIEADREVDWWSELDADLEIQEFMEARGLPFEEGGRE